MKKQLTVFIIFCILLAGIVVAVPSLENIYGPKNFADGLQSNGATVAVLDANSRVPLANSYTPDLSGYVPFDANSHVADSAIYDKHTNLDANSIGLGVAKDLSIPLKVFPNQDIVAEIGRSKIGYLGAGFEDQFSIRHYDATDATNFTLRASVGATVLNARDDLYFQLSGTTVAQINPTQGLYIASNLLTFDGRNSSSINPIRNINADTAGNILTLQSGGATISATDKEGGNLLLKSGIATGDGGSQIDFYGVSVSQGTGTTDRNPTLTASITGNGLTMAAGKTISSCNVEPIANDTYYIGKNSTTSDQKAYKGVILKDTTNTKSYRLEITNGAVVATEIYTP